MPLIHTGQFHGGKAIVKAVISLPADTFKLSGTGAKTSILYLQKRKARKEDLTQFEDQPQTDVFMGVADSLGYEVKNNVEDLRWVFACRNGHHLI